MKQYTILRSRVGQNNFTTLGDVRASSKSEAIKKMIQKMPNTQLKTFDYVALSASDRKFVSNILAKRIKKTGTGRV